jgi:hypothetical protein
MEVTIGGKTYVDTKRAAELTGYTRQHLRRLAREDQIVSSKQGIFIFLSLESLMVYKAEMEKLGTKKYRNKS